MTAFAVILSFVSPLCLIGFPFCPLLVLLRSGGKTPGKWKNVEKELENSGMVCYFIRHATVLAAVRTNPDHLVRSRKAAAGAVIETAFPGIVRKEPEVAAKLDGI